MVSLASLLSSHGQFESNRQTNSKYNCMMADKENKNKGGPVRSRLTTKSLQKKVDLAYVLKQYKEEALQNEKPDQQITTIDSSDDEQLQLASPSDVDTVNTLFKYVQDFNNLQTNAIPLDDSDYTAIPSTSKTPEPSKKSETKKSEHSKKRKATDSGKSCIPNKKPLMEIIIDITNSNL